MQLPVKKYVFTTLIPLIVFFFYGHLLLVTQYGGAILPVGVLMSTVATVTLVLAVWGLLVILHSYPTRVGIITYAVVLATVFSTVVSFTDIAVFRWLLSRDADLGTTRFPISENVLPLYIVINWIICTWMATQAALLKKNNELHARISLQKDTEALLRDAELYKLRQQLQPHFLYNSLNSINALTMIDPAKAQEMIGRLSDFLRSSVKREAQELLPIQEEIDYINAYLAIESVRFGDRLKIEFSSKNIDNAKIPPFILQPLLENAIKYGLYGNTGSVVIGINIVLNDGMLVISITNPYDAEGSNRKGTGFGLKAIQRRLYLIYARTDLLETTKDDHIFTTLLKIPQA